jgi:SAM-dependent methyltransferase
MKRDLPAEFPKLYTDLADWFHLLTAPEDYAEEAEFYRQAILTTSDQVPRTMLELGSGGGNNASHLKAHFKLTLVDISAQMLQISQQLNPECEHVQGDMRRIRLNRQFDVVFVHDAIVYMKTERELSSVIETAQLHCRPGGLVLLAPDHVKENFKPTTSHGGHDGTRGGIRFLDWTWDPDPSDTTYFSDMVYLIKNKKGQIKVVQDRHIMGLFPRQTWLGLLTKHGLQPGVIPFKHSQIELGTSEIFLARKIINI